MKQPALKTVAQMANLADRYISAWGTEASVPDSTLYDLLTSLGYDTRNDETLLASAEKKHKEGVLSPVQVIRDDEPLEVALHLGTSARESDFSWRIDTEQGECFEGYLQSQIVRDERREGGPLVFNLPCTLPWGYHRLSVMRKRRKTPYEMTLIVAPARCYMQPELDQHKKMWGPSIQLYTLRTPHNWGIGDFGDLKQLVSDLASRGADFVGLNPIHALFPANPEAASPYSPSSRRWLNLLYIDVSAVSEFALSAKAQQLVGSADFQRRLQAVRETHWVDYSGVAALKMAVLPLLFEEFKQRHLTQDTARGRAFLDFVEQGGDSLKQQATFDALHQYLRADDDSIWGWPVFPEKYRRYESAATQAFVEQHQDSVHLYMYLQWIA
ncbi:4-alpha-glucanotransferase, partial [Salinivibrio sp. PR919]